MTADTLELGKYIHIQLVPDWTPSKNERIIRPHVLFKVANGSTVTDLTSVAVNSFDEHGRDLGPIAVPLASHSEPSLEGPGWRRLSGSLVPIADGVEQLQAFLPDGVSSDKVFRRDAHVPVLLVPIPFQIGVPGEPHLWWRFYNAGPEAVRALDILNEHTVWLDGTPHHPVFGSYDGPSFLEPGRAFSSFWSLDQIDRSARRGVHRLQLDILDISSNTCDVEWAGDPGSLQISPNADGATAH